MGVPYTPEQLRKLGLIEVNGVYVKASSQVVKGKVEKIEPGIPMFNTAPKESLLIPKGMTDEERNNINVDSARKMFMPEKKGYAIVSTGDTFLLPTGGYVDVKYRFVIDPVPAPRMTQSDKWKTDPNHTDPDKRQRKPVENYFRFKNRLVSLCEVSGYKLTKTLNIIFVVPFPKSYSAKRKAELDGKPHDQKPDIDNFSKCWMDSLSDNDREVWNLHAIKVWGYEGQIIIF